MEKWNGRIGFILLLAVAVLSSCSKFETPKFQKVEHFKMKSLGLKESKVGFDVTFLNPNKFNIRVKEAVCDVYIDSVYAGKFIQDHEVTAESSTSFSIPLTGSIPMSTALQLDINKIVNGDVFFKTDGSVKVGRGGIFINKPFHYEGTRKVQL